jgi:hypothetical protein
MAIVVDIEFRLGSTTVSAESTARHGFAYVIPLRVVCGVGWTE